MKDVFFEQSESPRERLWGKFSAEVDLLKDRLGKEIDPNIKNTVIALRALGFSTNSSCEGHLDHGLKAPWVDIGLVPEDVVILIKSVHAGHQEITPEAERRLQEVRQELLLERKKLLDLLDDFYHNRPRACFLRLMLDYGPNTVRLINQGVGVQDLYESSEQAKNLEMFRQEMFDFTEFLKARISE